MGKKLGDEQEYMYLFVEGKRRKKKKKTFSRFLLQLLGFSFRQFVGWFVDFWGVQKLSEWGKIIYKSQLKTIGKNQWTEETRKLN